MIGPAINELRLTLLRNGFTPLANVDKRCVLKGWPRLDVNDELISKHWSRMRAYTATGLRLQDRLTMVDIDIDDGPGVVAILEAFAEQFPKIFGPNATPLLRRGRGAKIALFVRHAPTKEPFGRPHSRRWLKPGTIEDDGAHGIEILSGKGRQAGAFGPHSHDARGNVLVEYRWDSASPLDVCLVQLPVMTAEELCSLCDAGDRVLEQAGWTQVRGSSAGQDAVTHVYDLVPSMIFHCSDGETRSLAELVALSRLGPPGLRCSASPWEGASARRTDRCLIGCDHHGRLTVFETASGITHRVKPGEIDLNDIKALLRQKEGLHG